MREYLLCNPGGHGHFGPRIIDSLWSGPLLRLTSSPTGISGRHYFLGMIADYMDSLVAYRADSYRNLFSEAGMVGQVLYLEAEEAGIRSTGIGCYFDDPVHEVFSIVSRDWQSFCHFAFGGPVEDVRLTTLPAYGPERGNLPDPTVPCY